MYVNVKLHVITSSTRVNQCAGDSVAGGNKENGRDTIHNTCRCASRRKKWHVFFL
jgi:hypothetical protein